LHAVSGADEQRFPSVGYGTDYRFKKPRAAGSALVHEEQVVHTAFFNLGDQATDAAGMASLRHRLRRYTQ